LSKRSNTKANQLNLHQANGFAQGDNRVWLDANRPDVDFGYSDGHEIEQRLKYIFENAEDLSSTSYELQSHISDWPTEYHLTPKRANLLRALDLTKVKRVLELGCGCGSVTRYLGELGIEVDSVEGSPIRAELAALRNRDLPNVNISTANFNDIDFPQDYYDLVLYVGVTEYAGRFSNGKDDEAALQDLLALAKNAATKTGVVFVAIENRTGMKYVMGANEDHYAKPYIGVHNYAQPAGIRTYTKKEWQSQIATAGFSQHEFIYPFPDYKIPTIFLAEDYVQSNPHCYSHLETNRSRDYVEDFPVGSKEALLWEAAATSGTLGDYANSFLILMSNQIESINALSRHDFLHLPSYTRKAEYCMAIGKRKGADSVERSKVIAVESSSNEQKVFEHRVIDNEPFHQGPLLSVEWARALISYHDTQVFDDFLQDYWQFLNDLPDQKRSFDLLPSNIILKGEKKNYHVIDEEWVSEQIFAADFIFYRAVLFFYSTYPDFIQEKLVPSKKLHSIGDWFDYAFQIIGVELNDTKLQQFVEQNQVFQDQVSLEPGVLDFAAPLISLPVASRLLWRKEETEYDDQHCVVVHGEGHVDRSVLQFSLPSTARDFSRILFYPCCDVEEERTGFFRIYSVALHAVDETGKTRELWSLDTESEVAEGAFAIDANYESDFLNSDSQSSSSSGSRYSGSGYYVSGEYPVLEWVLGESLNVAGNEILRVSIDLRYSRSQQYLQIKERYTSKYTEQSLRLREAQALHQHEVAQNQKLVSMGVPLSSRCVHGVINRLRAIKHHAIGYLNKSKKKSNQYALSSEKKANDAPLISIIVPFKDEAHLLQQCIDSILQYTDYANFEIIGISNDSTGPETYVVMQQLQQRDTRVRFIEHNIPFNFSALVNYGVQQSQGTHVLLLNNDIEIHSANWLNQLISYSALPEVGAVGAKLLFPDDTIQHVGIHLDAEGMPAHTHKDLSDKLPQLMAETQNIHKVSAVTGALLMVKKALYQSLGGFDESDFGVAFNDVDFCLRLREQGLHNICMPNVVAIHHESASRGYEDTLEKQQRFENEKQAFRTRHAGAIQQGDPYFKGVGIFS